MLNTDLYAGHIKEILDEHVQQNKRKFVIYPNGEISQLVIRILKDEYKITPQFIVDNYRHNQENIFSLEQADKLFGNDMYYLICSDNEMYYAEIRNMLKLHVRQEQIIDLFPISDVKHYTKKAETMLENFDKEMELYIQNKF